MQRGFAASGGCISEDVGNKCGCERGRREEKEINEQV